MTIPAEPRTPFVSASGPWSPASLLRALATAGVGCTGVAVTWAGASSESRWTDQLAWLSGGAAALALTITAGAGWLLTGLRTVRMMRAEVVAAAAERLGDGRRVRVTTADGDAVWTLDGSRRFHEQDCLLLRNKRAVARARSDALSLGLTACGVCAR